MNNAVIIAASTAAALGVVLFLARYTFWRPWRSAKLPRILMYHRVAEVPASGMNCPPARFERHLQWLTRMGYRFVTASELEQGEAPRSVVLTFDDGYADNYQQMFPLLRRYAAKATIYLAPRISGIERLRDEEIVEMSQSGLVEFGAHTVTHVNLRTLSPEKARQEIVDSKLEVERLTQKPCHTFSYPFGRYNPEHVTMVAEAGFGSAVTVRKAIAPFARCRHELPRISMHGGMDWLQFRIALGTGRYRL